MPIFEFDGKRYDVEDRYMNDFSKAFPDATSVFERENKRYRVKASDYGSFMKYYQDPINDSVSSEEGTEGSDSYLKDLGEGFMQGVGSLGKTVLSPLKKAAGYINESDLGKSINERLGLEGGQFGEWYDSADKMEKEYAKRSDRYEGEDFVQLLKDGRYADALGEVFLSATKSAPTSLGVMAASALGSPAAGLAALGAGTASEKYDQLGEENPDMGSGAKMVNSLFTGLFEAGTEYLGAGAAGTAIRQLLKSAGREAAGDAIKKSLMQKSADFMKKHYIVGPIAEEAMEETVNALGEYITDELTGVDRKDNIVETMLKSGVYGAAGGAQYSPIIAGARLVGNKMSKNNVQNAPSQLNGQINMSESDQGVNTPPQFTQSRFAEAEEQGRNMTDPGDIRMTNQKMEETRASLSEMAPGLASTIESYVDDGASEAQIMSLLNGVNADARRLAEDFYADYLKIFGLNKRVGKEIGNEVETYVANNITPYVTTNPDGQSIVTTATLSEGNEERPVYVRSIEGDKAVISDNGQDRMVSVKRLSDIVEQDADQMKQAYEDQLLATRQSGLDMAMHHNPKTQLPKPGLVIWNGDNAFILQGQDENGDWIAQPAAYDKETGQVTAKNGSSPAIPITENEILNLQDAVYDAKQANEVPQDIDNVTSIDANMTSVPTTEDTINQPTSEIETEGAIDQIAQPSNVENPSMVMREDGTPDFVSSGTDMALDFLYDKYGDKMPRKIEVTRKSFDESLKKASDALEKAQEAYDDAPIGKEDKPEAALIKARQEYEAIKVEADFWANLDNRLKEESEKATATSGQVIDISEKEDTEPVDIKNEDVVTQEGASGEVRPIGKGPFGNIYDQFKGKVKEAFDFLVNHKEGDLLGVFHRDGIGSIDLVWGNDNGGLKHIIKRHIEEQNDFSDVSEIQSAINDAISNGDIVRENEDKIVLQTDRYKVSINKQYRDENGNVIERKNWIVTAFDKAKKKGEKKNTPSRETLTTPSSNLNKADGVTLPSNGGIFTDKGSISSSENQANEAKSFVSPSPKENENPLDYAERIVEAKRLHDEELKVDTNPSEAQKEAGNYKKGHVKINGFDVTIEQPAGSVRSGKDANGKEWSVTMNNTYGYIRGTEGVDGDHIDVFLGPDMSSDMVYVVDQVNTDGSFDEHKVMMGFPSLEDARSAYFSNYEEGWQGLCNITGVTLDEFKKWIDSSTRKTKPFSEYRSVKAIEEKTNNAKPKMPLTEDEYAEQRSKEIMGDNPGMDDIDVYNQALDEYPSYIRKMVDNGSMRDLYLKGSVGERIKLGKIMNAAGFELSEISKGLREESIMESDFKVGDKVTIRFYDGLYHTGEISKMSKDGKVTISADGKNYTVSQDRILSDSGIRFRETRIIPEEENIIKKAKSDGSYMKAPNGNPTNLNEKQWVQVRTKAFKEWFGDWENNPEDASKVIDENGEPRVVYHGTYSDFNAFDESHLGDVTDLNATNEDWAKTSHIGFWFNDNKIGFYTKYKPVYLNVRNPLEFASMESLVDEMSYYDSGEDFKRSNSDGYDSVIVLEDEEMGGRSYVVFNDNQIKSATENNEDFSFHNDETSKNEAVKQASEIDGAHFRSIGDKDTDNLNNAETIESSINDWSTKFNTPVKVIHDVDDITDTNENMLARKRDSKGWYDTSTGEIVIVSPNSTSVGDAQRTFLHEVVGHHGLRELFGDDFDTFLDNVYRNANEDIRKNIIDRTKGNPLNLREATEEYIAELAERGFDNKAERSLWEKIKDAFLDMLRKAGISLDFKLSDNDLRYILWRSYKNLEQGNLMDVAEDIVMRNRLGLNNINLNENGSIERDIEPEKGKQPSETKGTGRELETIEGVNENGNESERDHIDKPRGVENAIDGTENATDRNGKKTDGQVDNDGDQLDGGDTVDRNGSVRDGIDGERTVIGRAGSENKGRGVGESVREKTDDFAFAEKTIRFRENARNESVLFADNDIQVVEKQVGSAKDQYERTLSTSSYQFQEAFQDSMLGLKTLQDAVAKATRSRILDYENAYMGENALSSVNEAEFNAYRKAAFEPILKAISRLEKMVSSIDEIRDYLITKHGIERNREMAVKRALSQNSETYKSLLDEYIGRRNEIRENGRSWEEQQSEMDRLAEGYGANLSDDFSGFTSMYPNEDNTGYDPDSARRYVLDYESRYDTSELSASVKRATDAILAKQRDSGLMSQNTFDSISDMYQFYVPLRGWEETTADEVYAYLTSESQTFNAPIKTVVGRKSKADDPIATIANMAESGIMQGNRNLMKQKFLTMVQNHKTDLVSVSEMWVRLDEASGEWIAVFPDIPSNANPEQVESIVESFNKRMEELSNEKGSNVRRSRDAIGIPYKILPKDLKEHQVIVKRAGKEYVLTINGNPRAAQALNGLTNPDNTKGWFGTVERYAGWLNRNLAANFTTRNPNFMVSNFLRDALYSNTTVWVKESPVYAWRFNKNFAMVNPINMFRLVRRYENGKLDMSDPLNKAYHDFVMRGGETGYTNLRDVEAKKKAIQKELQYSKQKVSIGKALKVLGEWMDLFNKSVENCARFAAFLTSREMGRSMDKSIYDAKEISVNFNKKGSGSKFLNTEGQTAIGNASAFTSGLSRSMYIFWNAGVQGMYNFGRLAKNNPKKFLGLASSFYLLGTIMPMLAAAFGDDDDDYYDLPEYVRRNNICFRNGGGNWITIPMPIELRAIYGLGEMSSGIVSGKEKYTDKKMAMKIAEQMSQVLPLDMMEGGGGFSAFVPSSVKPLIEAGDNKDWTGLPLYKENDFNKGMPEWTKAFKSVDPAILAMTKYANELTGGNKYSKGDVNLNPAIIEHILDGYFGGIEATRSQLVKSAETAWGSRDFDWRNIPVGNRLIKSGDERTKKKAIDNAYYENLEEMDKIALRLRGYEKELDDPKNDDFEIAKYQKLLNDLEDSEEYERYEVFMDLNSELKSMMDDFKESGDDELEKEMYELKAMMNEIAKVNK